MRTRRILSGCDGRTTPTTETTRTRMFARPFFFFLVFCPPGRKLCQVPAASPLDALAPLHSRQSQRRDPGARHRAAAVLVRSPVAAPPGAIPPAPLKRKHSPTRGGSLERISRAARRRGAAGKIPAFERERARFGSGLGLGLGLTRGGIARRDARRRLTEKPATRNAGGDDHRLEARRAESIFTFV